MKVLKYVAASLMACTLLFQGATHFASAQTSEDPTIRIGVVPTVGSLTIGGQGAFELIDKYTGEVLFTGMDEEMFVELGSASTVQTHYRLQVAFTTSQVYLDDWLRRAHAEGYPTYVEDYNGGYRLYLGEFAADASFADRTAFKDEVVAKGLAASDSFWKVVTIAEGETQLKVTKNGEEKETSNPVQVLAPSGFVKINGQTYRGLAEVGFKAAERWRVSMN